jgi:hypothetical protein
VVCALDWEQIAPVYPLHPTKRRLTNAIKKVERKKSKTAQPEKNKCPQKTHFPGGILFRVFLTPLAEKRPNTHPMSLDGGAGLARSPGMGGTWDALSGHLTALAIGWGGWDWGHMTYVIAQRAI